MNCDFNVGDMIECKETCYRSSLTQADFIKGKKYEIVDKELLIGTGAYVYVVRGEFRFRVRSFTFYSVELSESFKSKNEIRKEKIMKLNEL